MQWYCSQLFILIFESLYTQVKRLISSKTLENFWWHYLSLSLSIYYVQLCEPIVAKLQTPQLRAVGSDSTSKSLNSIYIASTIFFSYFYCCLFYYLILFHSFISMHGHVVFTHIHILFYCIYIYYYIVAVYYICIHLFLSFIISASTILSFS